jgi:acetyltransferase-like isoleucine patch superfamily enzyme
MIFAKLDAARRRLAIALRSAAMRGYIRLAHPGIRCHSSVRFGRGVTIRAFAGGSGEIGAGTMIHDMALLQVEGGRLVIGSGCLIGRGCVIVCTSAITVGEGTLMAEYVTIRDQDHRVEGTGRLDGKGLAAAAITIGHDVWLAAKVTVTRGVEIAPHVAVGANAVVTRSLPERGVYGGAPARLLVRSAGAA